MSARLRTRGLLRQAGAGMIETMVGIMIGLLVVLVIYNLLAVTEGYKRSTMGLADAQTTGLLSQFLASRDAGNGGNGISLAAPDLINCRFDEAGTADLTLKPVPVLVTAGASDHASDSFVSTHSASPHVLWPVSFTAPLPAVLTDGFTVQSPTGFSATDGTSLPTVANPHWAIVMSNETAGLNAYKCKRVKITNATVPSVGGQVTLTHDGVAVLYGSRAKLLNLGPDGFATSNRYDVFNTSTGTNCSALNSGGCQLFTTDLMTAGAVRNPIAQNVVLMKVQYGIDTDSNERIDCWTPADNSNVCGDGRNYTDIRSFTVIEDVNRILAVRIGIVVRSDEPDLNDPNLVAGTRPPVVLFNCAANTNLGCPRRITLPAGPASTVGVPTCNPNIICDNWRYSAYEMVVPLRNTLYNATLP